MHKDHAGAVADDADEAESAIKDEGEGEGSSTPAAAAAASAPAAPAASAPPAAKRQRVSAPRTLPTAVDAPAIAAAAAVATLASTSVAIAAPAPALVAPTALESAPVVHMCGMCTTPFANAALLAMHLQLHVRPAPVVAAASAIPQLALGGVPASSAFGSVSFAANAGAVPPSAAAAAPSALLPSGSGPVVVVPPTQPSKRPRPRPTSVFPCPYAGCTSSFNYRHVLANHVRAKHTFETPFACRVCDKRFPTLARQSAHQQTHLTL